MTEPVPPEMGASAVESPAPELEGSKSQGSSKHEEESTLVEPHSSSIPKPETSVDSVKEVPRPSDVVGEETSLISRPESELGERQGKVTVMPQPHGDGQPQVSELTKSEPEEEPEAQTTPKNMTEEVGLLTPAAMQADADRRAAIQDLIKKNGPG